MSSQASLLQAGLDALEHHRYADAVTFLEQACQASTDSNSREHVRSQLSLAKAYQRNGQTEHAATLCQQLASHANPQVKQWAEQALRSLSKSSVTSPHPSSDSSPQSKPESKLNLLPQQARELLKTGSEALKQKRYAEAIQPLETYCSIDPNLSYCPFASTYSSRTAFIESQLFKHLANPDRFSEDDCVVGQIGETRIAFSEICAEHESYQSDDSDYRIRSLRAFHYVGKRLLKGQRIVSADFLSEVFGNVSRSPIFKGIFFTANFNKQFQFQTFVFPDGVEGLLGGLASTFQSMNKRHGQLVKLEDLEFERWFAVYSEDQVEARYILSTNLMERLVRFRKKSNHDVSIAFVNNTIYVAIAYDEDLFEPKLYTSMLSFKPIQDYFENLQLVIGIVEDLKLNRRIWATTTERHKK
jgi:Protein of unknown function (DUF3137)